MQKITHISIRIILNIAIICSALMILVLYAILVTVATVVEWLRSSWKSTH